MNDSLLFFCIAGLQFYIRIPAAGPDTCTCNVKAKLEFGNDKRKKRFKWKKHSICYSVVCRLPRQVEALMGHFESFIYKSNRRRQNKFLGER